jgi:hypothetical protein
MRNCRQNYFLTACKEQARELIFYFWATQHQALSNFGFRGENCIMKTKIKTQRALLACLLTTAIAMPAWSDTLILKNGVSFSGTLTGANINSIMFKDRRGVLHRYSVYDVEAVQFGDAPKHSGVRPPEYDQSTYERPNDRNDGNTQAYGNNDNRGYDQTSYERIDERGNSNDQDYGKHDDSDHDQRRMERVILPAGTELALMTNQRIDSHEVVQGQTFSAQIAEDIRDTDGSIAIPRGSDATLITRRLEGNGDITLDVESVTVAGRRYRISTADQELENRRDGVGANKRTGKFVGGGAALGAIIGAIAGGGKGAAIGAVAGAGAGAGAQIITRGKEVHVPAESVLRFRLDRPLWLRFWS